MSKVWQIRVWVLEENEIWGEWCLGTNQLSTVMSLHWSEAAALVKNTIIQSSFVIRSINFEMVYWMMLWTFSICAGNWVVKRILAWNDTWEQDQIRCFAVNQWIVLSAKKIIPSFIGTEICWLILSHLIRWWAQEILRAAANIKMFRLWLKDHSNSLYKIYFLLSELISFSLGAEGSVSSDNSFQNNFPPKSPGPELEPSLPSTVQFNNCLLWSYTTTLLVMSVLLV